MKPDLEKIITGKIDSELNQKLMKYFIDVFDKRYINAKPYASSKSNRKTVEYGYSYRNMRDNATFLLSNPIPSILTELYQEIRQSLISKANINIVNTFDTCLVNLYTTGVDLFPHVDKDPAQATIENRPFYFGEQVIGVILLADSEGGLYIQKIEENELKEYNPSKAIHLNEKDGTTYILKNQNRFAPWHHGVSPIKTKRISATFRTLHRYSDSKRMNVPSSHYLPVGEL